MLKLHEQTHGAQPNLIKIMICFMLRPNEFVFDSESILPVAANTSNAAINKRALKNKTSSVM